MAALGKEVEARRAVLWAGGGARGRRRLGRRRSALFTADGAYAYSQSHRHRLVQRQDRAVGTQDIRADDGRKRAAFYYQHRMTHRDACDFNRHVNLTANHSACASNADDFRSGAQEGCIAGASGSRAYKAALSIDSAEPVSTRACATRTPFITPSATSCPALLQEDATTPKV